MSFVKQTGVLLLLAAVAAGGWWGWQQFAGDKAGARPEKGRRGGGVAIVETARAEIRNLDTLIEAIGSTRARRSVEITPLTAGRVTEVGFSAGKSVTAGTVLLRLDSDIQRADLIEARARLTEAASALKRAQSLKKSNTVSASTVDKLVAVVATTRADHERARRRLGDRTVTAPFDGVVGFSRVAVGARVKEGDSVTTLDDLSLVEIEFSLPEGLYGRIVPGQRIVANATAFPGREFEGVIETIDSRIDRVSRSYKARAVVANPELALPSGMFMHLSVVLDAVRVLTVPEEAIIVDGRLAFVYVVKKTGKGERALRRDVTLGRRSFGHVEIASGVAEGDEVVTRGVRVRDGAPIRRAKPPKAKGLSLKGAAG